jgi:hypothetical protein
MNFVVHAQFLNNSEIGIMMGGANYTGDINNSLAGAGSKFMNQFETSFDFYNVTFMAGFIYRYNVSNRWAVRGNILFSKLWGDDIHFDNPRNLNFSTWCNEISFVMEFNFLDYKAGSNKYRFSPYMFAGLAFFYMNPKTEILNPKTQELEEVVLRDLHTEGQGLSDYSTPYSNIQLAIPFGLGIKWSLSKYISIGFEYGWRKTFTDYLDDISTYYVDNNDLQNMAGTLTAAAADRTHEIQPNFYHKGGEMRGNPETKDWYNFFGMTFTVKLPTPQHCDTYKSR